MARPLAGVFAWLLVVAGVFVWFADVRINEPLWPPRAQPLEFERLQSPARLQRVGDELRISGADRSGTTVVLQTVEALSAEDFRYFTLRLDEVPPTLRAMVVWRAGGALHAAPLPGAQFGSSTFDLKSHERWSGPIEAIGFGLVATDYLAPTLSLEREFVLVSATLEGPSWSGAVREQLSDWFAYRPWTGRSNNTGGFEHSTEPGPSLTLFVLVAVVAAVAIALVVIGPVAARRATAVALVVAVASLAGWQSMQLIQRARVAASAASIAGSQPDWPLAASPAVAYEALQLDRLLQEAPPRRVMLLGEGRFLGEYPTWFLRRFNAGSLHSPADLAAIGPELPGSILVLAGTGDWSSDRAGRQLVVGGSGFAVTPVMRGNVLQAYRIDSTGAPVR